MVSKRAHLSFHCCKASSDLPFSFVTSSSDSSKPVRAVLRDVISTLWFSSSCNFSSITSVSIPSCSSTLAILSTISFTCSSSFLIFSEASSLANVIFSSRQNFSFSQRATLVSRLAHLSFHICKDCSSCPFSFVISSSASSKQEISSFLLSSNWTFSSMASVSLPSCSFTPDNRSSISFIWSSSCLIFSDASCWQKDFSSSDWISSCLALAILFCNRATSLSRLVHTFCNSFRSWWSRFLSLSLSSNAICKESAFIWVAVLHVPAFSSSSTLAARASFPALTLSNSACSSVEFSQSNNKWFSQSIEQKRTTQ